ncbi:nicotinate (nicotinamide) nucleotide adenylyltransferase [Gynuella sunshinyii]|uniref:Probable nicotinate-nucleotide adenylyltransferase n=1 Tax=Gynuella sunshinyii YC6258 TaxID=1445510 RepID=A0A0C5VJJ4_9GAMM|nr:nicotinate (nicotinamide) nucleotide adenylyltransferase [Gynuella sunshinyii]AJQ94461.1 nicotinic acid mononucleotide adenylyltransferase [Gynuella sunshinyii YC6258]
MIAVFGGTFDPFHFGHLKLIRHCMKYLQPDELRLLPCYQPVHKSAAHGPVEHRLAILRLAISELPAHWAQKCVIDEREIKSSQPVYTYESMLSMRAEIGNDESLVFVMGADSLQSFHNWGHWREILDLVHLAVFARPRYSLEQMSPFLQNQLQHRQTFSVSDLSQKPAGSIWVDDTLAADVSSTELRTQSGPRKEWLSDKIRAYIDAHHLYNDSK